MKNMNLGELPENIAAKIVGLKMRGAMRKRLIELGAARGARVMCLHTAPLGDPRAYEIGGAVIALRNSDAAAVLVREAGD